MAALQIRDLWKRFGSLDVLKGIDLEIDNGAFTVLVGPSGCGKSTLLNIVAGLERPSAGTIEIGGRVVNDVEPKDRDIAMVFQSYALYPSMTVRQNITFGMECRHIPKPEQDAALANVARLLQIEQLLERKPSQLSGGQQPVTAALISLSAVVNSEPMHGEQSAAVLIAALPPLLVYLFGGRYFMSGLTAGAVK